MIIPSIDLIDGKAVQLRQGKEKMLERENPVELAQNFNKFGEIAVIDLDAAMGKGSNTDLVKQICKNSDCRVGGGIRNVETAKELISFGAKKIIIGSKAFEGDHVNHQFLSALADAVGKQSVIIAVDAYKGEIVTRAWRHRTGLNLFDVIETVEPYASEFLFTCVEKEGGLMGTDIQAVQKLKNKTHNRITLAGGITTINEIQILSALGVNAQLGMAIYTGKMKLEEAFVQSLNWKNDLLPTVTVDTNGQVLMLAYSNKETIQRTFESGKMWYFSRSRNQLWQKGESSGNIQKFVQFRPDCDSDSLLATVEQTGVACHLGSYSCFGDKKFSLNELYDVINYRLKNPNGNSYTATLTEKKVREKLIEEAHEVIEAQSKDEIIWEAADVLYFLTVLMAKSGVSNDEVLDELKRRRKK